MTTRSEELAEQGRLRFVAVLAGAIAGGMKLEEWFALLDDELRALAPRREAFERELAEAWLEQQAQTFRRRALTAGVARRAAAGDPVALAVVKERIAAGIADGDGRAGAGLGHGRGAGAARSLAAGDRGGEQSVSRLYWRPFHEVMARVSALKLGEKPKIVLLAVLRYANKEGRAWPSLKTLAADTEMSVSSVARAIERVKERVPAVTIERQGKTKPNLYSVPVEWVYGAGLIGQPDQSLEASTADRRGVIGQTDPSDRSGSAGVIGQPDHRSSTNSKKDFQEEIRHSHRSKRPTDATPSRAELLEGFDAVWEALPKVLSYGDAKVRS